MNREWAVYSAGLGKSDGVPMMRLISMLWTGRKSKQARSGVIRPGTVHTCACLCGSAGMACSALNLGQRKSCAPNPFGPEPRQRPERRGADGFFFFWTDLASGDKATRSAGHKNSEESLQ